jgi:hypothetical protein
VCSKVGLIMGGQVMGGQVMGGHHCGCQERKSYVRNEDLMNETP